MSQHPFDKFNLELRQFAIDRDWEQFQSPKNVAMALIVEAAELVEHFQWLSEDESYQLPAEKRKAVAHEMADVLIYLMRLSDRLDIDLMQAVEEKIQLNAEKYPVEKVKGSAKKYSEYD